MNTKIKLMTIFLIFIAILSSGIIYKHLIDKKAVKLYTQGEKLYRSYKYSDAYYNFKQIKHFSNLYELALLKQYECANNLSDKKTSLLTLREIIKTTKNKHIRPWALYNEAILSRELKLNNDNTSYKKFKYIYKHFKETDFGIASAYKMAVLEENKNSNLSKDCYIKYLSYAPFGKYSKNAIKEIEKSNLPLSEEEYKIIADSYYSNEEYQNAIDNYKKSSYSKNWYKISKCYKNLNNKTAEKETILYGLSRKNNSTDEKEYQEAINRLKKITQQNEIGLLQYLYENYNEADSYPTIIYKLAEKSSELRAMKLYELIVNKYHDSIWASNSVWELFWYSYNQSRFQLCEKLAKRHFLLYSKTQDGPRIAYWYGRALLKEKKKSQAKEVFYKVIKDYPFSYYAFLSTRQLKTSRAKKMILKKPIKKYDMNTLNKYIFDNDKILLYLANNNDWQLIDNLKISDEKIKSWTQYQKGNYLSSINIIKKDLFQKDVNQLDENNNEEEENSAINFSNQLVKLMYPILYEKEINLYSTEYKQSAYLFLSLIREESHFNSKAKSSVGAIGLSQLMPSTANFIEKNTVSQKDLFNPDKNIKIGIKYFNYLTDIFEDNEYLAILAYNAGPGNIKKWLKNDDINTGQIDEFVENIPYLETKSYIKKVLSSYWTYINIYSPKNK